jgi:hypothetical protein
MLSDFSPNTTTFLGDPMRAGLIGVSFEGVRPPFDVEGAKLAAQKAYDPLSAIYQHIC